MLFTAVVADIAGRDVGLLHVEAVAVGVLLALATLLHLLLVPAPPTYQAPVGLFLVPAPLRHRFSLLPGPPPSALPLFLHLLHL